jgi:Glycosyl transferase family 2
MNTTVLLHFYNEEYMLPWWIKHHQKLFENGILIDYNSTDRSVEICKDLAPNWRVVTSKNKKFDAIAVDKEVMEYESSVEGLKMALTATELFLPYCHLHELNKEFEDSGISGVRTYGTFMLDKEPDVTPSYDRSLVEQKPFGKLTGYTFDNGLGEYKPDFFKVYGRVIHKDSNGDYRPGRHETVRNYRERSDLYTLKFKYSPWNETTLSRLQQFKEKIPRSDFEKKAGIQHFFEEDKFIQAYKDNVETAIDLRTDNNFNKALDFFLSL